MPDVGLCMTVRNEATNILDCLSPIADLFAEIVVIDTGSTDETTQLLREVLAIEPYCQNLAENECFTLATVRNYGFGLLSTPWLMTLDADERIDPAELRAVIALEDADLPSGLFSRWDTDFGDGTIIEDYKMNLFRRAHRHRGLVHDTAQPSLRASADRACWLPHMRIEHRPDPSRRGKKEDYYAWRLQCAARREPHWLRYRWFSGYMAYRQGRMEEAEAMLQRLHDARPELFPVESLNASMVLAAIYARRGEKMATEAILANALEYHAAIADDFEVRVNFRLEPWLQEAKASASRGKLDAIDPYPFPY